MGQEAEALQLANPRLAELGRKYGAMAAPAAAAAPTTGGAALGAGLVLVSLTCGEATSPGVRKGTHQKKLPGGVLFYNRFGRSRLSVLCSSPLSGHLHGEVLF